MKRFILTFAVMGLCLLSASAQTQKKKRAYDYTAQPQSVAAVDTTSVLCIGNSYTFYYNTDQMLLEIAASQRHCLLVKAATVGGYSFASHLGDNKTTAAIENFDTYDVVFLQNRSQLNAQIARNPKQYALAIDDAKQLAARVRAYSPDARIIFEASWASYVNTTHFNDFEDFDRYMLKGTRMLAKKNHAEISPLCTAFALARSQYPEINLLYKDRHHQSKAGAYLKSCVNYLLIFGGQFDANVSDCTVDPRQAKCLREVAYQTIRSMGK